MKVSLVTPNIRERTEKGTADINVHIPVQSYPFLGVAYLASTLEHNGIEVEVVDSSALNLTEDQVVTKLRNNGSDIVGIYVTSFSLPFTYALIKKIKQCTEAIVIVGGPHITHYPKSVFTLNADYGMVGDGEKCLVEFVRSMSNGKIDTNIGGLVYKRNGAVIANPKNNVKDLDDLPFPARHLLPNDKYYFPLHKGKITTMITSRGCVFDCIFCALPTRKSFRQRSIENIISEIQQLAAEGFEYVGIVDDFFTYNKKKVAKLCELLLDKRIEINWGCETRADFVDRELLYLMKRAGCTNIHFGIESGNERVRNKIVKKQISNNALEKAFSLCKEVGLETVGYFMFGHPTETLEEMKQTVEFAKKIKPDYPEFHIAVPIPGSRLFELAKNEGKIPVDIWDRAIEGEPIPFYVPDGVKLSDIRALQSEAYGSFYLNFSKILKEAVKVRSLSDFNIRLKSGIRIFKDKYLRM
jgi:radical SAM superfamily enzyme YgiQ (UPF0313 family)